MLLSQVEIVFIDNYKTLVENWITVNNVVYNANRFLLRVLEMLTLALNRFRYLNFNCFKVKTTYNRAKENIRAKENKKKAKS